MADRQYSELTETKPRRPGFSLLSKGLAGADEFVSQNKLGALLSSGLGVPDAAKLLEKLAYGDRLTTGSGLATKPADGVVEGLLLAPALGKGLVGAGRLVKGFARGR